ncbi:MAG: FAD-linked oxidase C-terminal domain-containing protein [Thermoanaerobaculia bacterium]
MTRFPPLSSETLAGLRHLLGETGVLTDSVSLGAYGVDETEELDFRPDAVALPETTEQVAAVLQLAAQTGIPVTPRGGGTGLSGGALPVFGGLSLSLERLNRIRFLDQTNLMIEVEAGLITGDLKRAVEEKGLFYPPDPASHDSCQVGGNIAEDAAGPRSCKYGTTRNWVLGLEAVLPDGTVIRTGGATRKNAAGYNLTQLLVGSEGTLAVVTAALLKLINLPRFRLTLAAPFSTLQGAAQAVSRLFVAGVDPASCELMEARALDLVSSLTPIPEQLADAAALLLLELDGDDEQALLERAARASGVFDTLEEVEVIVAQEAGDQRRLWEIREKIAIAVREYSVYKEADTVVPRSELANLVEKARQVARDRQLEAVCYGHAGDGNLHVNLMRGDLDEVTWKENRDAAEAELFDWVAGVGGSVTGEHGIGWSQRRYLPLVAQPGAIEVMRGLKAAFYPRGILNTGKIFPDR